MNATFDSFKIPLEQFKMDKDGREWKHVAGQRRTMFIELSSFSNADGTNIFPKISTLMQRLGWSHGKVCYILDDLKEMGRVERTGRKGQRGPAIRKVIAPVSESKTQDSENPKLDPRSPKVESESPRLNPESPTAIGLHTCPTDLPVRPANLPTPKQAAGRLARIYGQAIGKGLPGGCGARNQALAEEAMRIAPGRVENFWELWLDQRDLTAMKFPLGIFVSELPGLIAADSSSEREYTMEELASFKAMIDRQTEIERNEIMNRMPEPERVLSAEDVFGTGS